MLLYARGENKGLGGLNKRKINTTRTSNKFVES